MGFERAQRLAEWWRGFIRRGQVCVVAISLWLLRVRVSGETTGQGSGGKVTGLRPIQTQIFSTVDPYLVAFNTTNAAQGTSRYTFNLAAANDDQAAGNLDPRFTWKNTTGSNKTVRIMAFAYDQNSGGRATLVVLNNGSVWNATRIMRGQIQYTDNVAGGGTCGLQHDW